jgi:hypothetical protein
MTRRNPIAKAVTRVRPQVVPDRRRRMLEKAEAAERGDRVETNDQQERK